MKRALFIFRRDLRLEDNTGLTFALEQAKEVIPCFIFTHEQIEENPYRSDHCLQFMIESLEDVEAEIRKKGGRLYLFLGKPEKVIAECIKELGIDGVVVNQDYTPFSIKRDRDIEHVCEKHGVAFHSFEDALLHPVLDTLKEDGQPYTVFTPYYRNAMKLEVMPPLHSRSGKFYSHSIPFAKDHSLFDKILKKRVEQQKGGRSAVIKILKGIHKLADYASLRDFPAEEDQTSHLSAHLKFNTCSIREAYRAIAKEFGPDSDLIRSLYWRDFFTSIAFHFPHVFKGAFRPKFDALEWSYDKRVFHQWCEGKTGFPIIDAGMRQMNETGFMHNRVRMIAASFLVKDLHIDWRWGERYFAQTLIDYDPAVNNGNWQWCASTGCDAQPYFRIFNPWTQGQKFDPECRYIKRWVPELKPFSADEIHKQKATDPIIDHSIESKKTLEAYKRCADEE